MIGLEKLVRCFSNYDEKSPGVLIYYVACTEMRRVDSIKIT